MKNNRTIARVIAVILALLMACSVLVGVIGSVGASAASISDLKDQQEQLAQEKADLEQKIEDAEGEQFSIIAKKQLIDESMNLTMNEIDNATALIEEYTQFIAEAEVEIAELEVKEQEQWEAYKTRVRVMEENGTISYLEVLLTATSFSDLLSRIDTIGEVMAKDRSIYNELVETRNKLTELKAEKEEALVEQEELKVELEEKKADLEDQLAEAEALIAEYQSNIEAYKDDVAAIEAEDARLDEEIENMENASSGSGSGSGSGVTAEGSFVWPSAASTYVTSRFGYRNSPTAGASTNHKGIDIGASYGTSVLAAKSGTVTTSTYSSSYGYYIVINHGDGTTTTYAHMSQLIAKKGQTVSQGEVIGKVGSTGISTGPHLHFEVTVGGSRVDPLQFFSNYTLSPSA